MYLRGFAHFKFINESRCVHQFPLLTPFQAFDFFNPVFLLQIPYISRHCAVILFNRSVCVYRTGEKTSPFPPLWNMKRTVLLFPDSTCFFIHLSLSPFVIFDRLHKNSAVFSPKPVPGGAANSLETHFHLIRGAKKEAPDHSGAS